MLKGKKILVTGGSGFIGTNLLLLLSKKGARITNVGIGKPPVKIKNAETIEIDLTKSDFSFVDEGFDFVAHLAALSTPRMCKDEKKAFEVNVEMTEKFFAKLNEEKIKKRLKKVIFISSVLVYSKDNKLPIAEDGKLDIEKNIYAKTKGLDEKICEHYRKKGLPIITVRLSNVYGPYQQWQGDANFVPFVLSEGIIKKNIEIKSGASVRDWIYVGDAAEAISAALESNFLGTVNAGTGIGTSAFEVAKIAGELTGAKVVDLNEKTDSPNIICDITRIRSEINWKPKTKLNEGMIKTYEHYKKSVDKMNSK